MLQKPKGTYDIYRDKSLERLYFKKLVEALMDKYNAKYFETPVFESSELFHRGVGETSDIVSKETLLAQIPFVEDVQAELDRLDKEKEDNPFYQSALNYQTAAMENSEEQDQSENLN